MKKTICLGLAVSMLSSTSLAQLTVYRAPGADIRQYRESITGNSFRITPVDVMASRLKAADLPAELQLKLDEALTLAAQTPDRAREAYKSVLVLAIQGPRTLAVRETMKALLGRLIPMVPADEADVYRQQKVSLEKIEGGAASEWTQKPTLTQQEIKTWLTQLKSKPGGEDAALFFNGVLWNERWDLNAQDTGQWIVLSSQWKPKLFEGTWAEFLMQPAQEPVNWVKGSCDQPEIQDLGFAPREKMAFFDFKCQGEGLSQAPIYHDPAIESRSRFDGKKTLMWTVIAVGLGMLALSASGKKLRINSN